MTCREFASNFLETVKAEPSEELLKVSSENVALLKSIRAHLDPGSACVNCLYSCHILYLWHTFLMGHTANF